MNTPHAQTIAAIRRQRGASLVIMGHHYQGGLVIQHTDLRGDSLELARQVRGLRAARHIVFCGVSFMAETAAMLAAPGQKVVSPAPEAGCVMADMAPGPLADAVLRRLTADGRRIIPLAYVNTDAHVKAVVARHGGSVCTSANAPAMLRWALERGDGVLFLPDKNLGHNTANILGLREDRRAVIDVSGMGAALDPAALRSKTLLLWPGMCVVHKRFTAAQVEAVRHRDPDALVVVHPECEPEVVGRADAAGSTSFIIRYVAEAPRGAAIYVGTELNLVERLAREHEGVRTVRPLTPSHCRNMAKTTEEVLAATLEDLDDIEPVTVPCDVARDAVVAIERMLEACR
ncbi:quinolinate synthase NadA [Desulfocurvus sp.]|jgi:quinolinate synthase|uniref:quinolinate synthase NadA n=1 Tax=Desulfocurvus sp. TaxID=2871698 RepID=UPI0025BB4903|nr:quinolinate synthase NadA [Desulfocurvus sp.]MCK9240045.1 quinolinate synthase NadA [Desulfocurvus sp.]